MWIGLAIGALIGMGQLVSSFRARHAPEPSNSRLKLPIMILLLGGCVAVAITHTSPVLFSILAAVIAVQIGFVLAGRNPWWMQAAIDKREYGHYTSPPPRNLD